MLYWTKTFPPKRRRTCVRSVLLLPLSLVVGVAGMDRQTVLSWAGLKIAYVSVYTASPVVTPALLDGPRASGLPAVEEETDRIPAEFCGCAPHLYSGSPPASACLVLLLLLRAAAPGGCAGWGLLWRIWGGRWGPPLVRGVPPPLPQLPVGQWGLLSVCSAGGFT